MKYRNSTTIHIAVAFLLLLAGCSKKRRFNHKTDYSFSFNTAEYNNDYKKPHVFAKNDTAIMFKIEHSDYILDSSIYVDIRDNTLGKCLFQGNYKDTIVVQVDKEYLYAKNHYMKLCFLNTPLRKGICWENDGSQYTNEFKSSRLKIKINTKKEYYNQVSLSTW